MKKVLNISKKIDIGSRFNNFALRSQFEQFEWQANFASWDIPKDPTQEIISVGTHFNDLINSTKKRISKITGDIDGYYSNSKYFMQLNAYKQADLLHLHIIHEHYLSLKDWSKISNGKPVVWTWHDPYPMNGHCIYSLDCTDFKGGCKSCPHLNYHYEILRDRSSKNLAERIEVVKKINPLVIVASNWMYERVRESRYGNQIRVEVLPFGIPIPQVAISRSDARKKLNIPEENIVIGLRAIQSVYKGMDLITHAINKLAHQHANLPVTILTFQEVGLVKSPAEKHQIIDLGWVDGEEVHQYYPAMDFFLMPSKAEAFGLMAIEAMMHGVFPLVTYGTALESLQMGGAGTLISMHEKNDYYDLLIKAILGHNYFLQNREILQYWATEKYSSKKFLTKLTSLYKEEYERYYHN